MNQRDREMMEKIFEAVEGESPDNERQELTPAEQEQVTAYLIMFDWFIEEVQQRFQDPRPCFFAPPTNFSLLMN